MAAHEYYNPNNSFVEDPIQPPTYPPPQYQPCTSTPPTPPQQQKMYHHLPQYPPIPRPNSRNEYPPRRPSTPYTTEVPYRPQYQPYPYPQPVPQQPHNSHYYTPHPPCLQNPNISPQPSHSYIRPIPPKRSYSEPSSPVSPREYHHHSSHHHHRHHSHSRSSSRTRELRRKAGAGEHKASNTFLGALGGGVIGDLIFPGLGTVGGALLGGWGGREVSGKRRGSHSGGNSGRGRRRDRYDEEYEEGKRRRGEL